MSELPRAELEYANDVPSGEIVGPDGAIVQRASTLVTERLEILDRQGKSLGKSPAPDGTFLSRALSPDRRHLAVSYPKPGDHTDPLYMLDLERGIFSRFSFDSENDQQPVWTPDGRRVIWGSDRPGGRSFSRPTAAKRARICGSSTSTASTSPVRC